MAGFPAKKGVDGGFPAKTVSIAASVKTIPLYVLTGRFSSNNGVYGGFPCKGR
jgi:hypothetical protein